MLWIVRLLNESEFQLKSKVLCVALVKEVKITWFMQWNFVAYCVSWYRIVPHYCTSIWLVLSNGDAFFKIDVSFSYNYILMFFWLLLLILLPRLFLLLLRLRLSCFTRSYDGLWELIWS